MKPMLTIAIPTFNNHQQVRDCLMSLLRHTDYPFEVLVVNNGEDYGMKASLEAVDTGNVEVLQAEKNLGWMGGINLALEHTKTPFFCMMNDDVLFLPGYSHFWRILVDHTNWERYGAAGPCSNFIAGVQSLFQLEVPMECETSALIGMCLVMETQFLKDLGGLDETLPGGDDLDLSIRIRAAGKQLLAQKTCYLHHIGQQTGRRVEGEYWDSPTHQERTVNALIRKHGVFKWASAYQASWRYVERFNDLVEENKPEQSWIRNRLEPFRGDGKVGLNLGCGNLTDYGEGLNLTHVDLAEPGDRGPGGRKYEGATPDLVADVLNLPQKDESQDYLVAAHLLEHLVDPVVALQEWGRVLKPGGKLFLQVPDHEVLATMLLDYTHVHAFTVASLTNLVKYLPKWKIGEVERGNAAREVRVVLEKVVPSYMEEYGEVAG